MFRRLAAFRSVRATRGRTDSTPVSVPTARIGGRRGASPASAQMDPTGAPVEPVPLDPGAPPDYFGGVPNFAHSPRPVPGPQGGVLAGTGIRKFIDSLPGLGTAHQNELGNYLPVAVPDTITYPGCDYYEIGLQQYTQQLHADLPVTRLRGYRQLNNGTDRDGHNTVSPPNRPYHLGPVIMAHRDRPVRIKFINQLPVGRAGTLFLPVDASVLPVDGVAEDNPSGLAAQHPGVLPLDGTSPGRGSTPPARQAPHNRAVLHLHGGATPWISAGNPDQWLLPAGEQDPVATGPGLRHVPDMPPPGAGSVTLYYPNQQSGRLLWLRDNTAGLSHLTVYSGQLAPYLLDDPVQRQLVDAGVLPAEQIPLVIQDRTFVPGDSQLAAEDPTWDRQTWGARGNLWFPHVYQPNQNPYHESGINPTGRWDYGPWLDPEAAGHGPVPNPRYDPVEPAGQPPVVPGVPHPSVVPEAFGDTMLVNGAAYPYLEVQPRAYRFRVLNACNDRVLNLQLYYAASSGQMWHADGSPRDADAGEVPMVPAAAGTGLPPGWPTDGRPGGVPDPAAAGPPLIQIGTGGGLLPAPVVLPNQPIDFVYDRRDAALLNVRAHTLLLGPGERADVIVDFSSVPPGSTLILYNDCPAPLPIFDPRYDHYTDGPDLRESGGAPPTRPGFGPNTRTLLQLRVSGAPAVPYDLAALESRLPAAYGASQPPPIVPQPAYDRALGTETAAGAVVPVQAGSLTFTPTGAAAPVTVAVVPKSIVERFDPGHGRLVTRLVAAGPTAGTPDGPGADPLSPIIADPVSPYRSGPSRPAIEPVSEILTADGTGTQVWRISNHGSVTDFIHFPGGQAQLVNRTGRDGAVRRPAGTELGWRDTVRIDPGEDAVVAVRAAVPQRLPFRVGDAPTRPGPAGWAYTWHSQLLGHQSTGMLRTLLVRVSPPPPSGLTVTAVAGSATQLPAIALRWTNNRGWPGATSMLIQRATDPDFAAGLTEIRVEATATGYVDTAVAPGTGYYHRIRAENAIGYSAWCPAGPAAVHLLAPTGLAASIPGAPLRVALSWNNRSFTTGVQVQRATNATFSSGLVTWTVAAGTGYVDDTVAVRTSYFYRVRTSYLGTYSPWSNVATGHTPGPPPAPTRLAAHTAAAEEGPATVRLTWTVDTGGQVGTFTVQRARDPRFDTDLTTYAVPGGTCRFDNTGLSRGSTYHYRVRAGNPAGTSPFSAPVVITTPH